MVTKVLCLLCQQQNSNFEAWLTSEGVSDPFPAAFGVLDLIVVIVIEDEFFAEAILQLQTIINILKACFVVKIFRRQNS